MKLLNNFSKLINSGKFSKSLVKIKRVVCPNCLSSEVVSIKKRVEIIKCNSCGFKYEVKKD